MRKLKKSVKRNFLILGVVGAGVLNYVAPKLISAYYTDTFKDVNRFTVKEVTGSITEEFPTPPPVPPEIPGDSYDYEYQKDVNVQNDSDLPVYVRVAMNITDPEIADVTKYSCDGGNTWYSVDDYKNHLPDGWTYVEGDSSLGNGGFFYYTKPVAAHGKPATSLLTRVKTTYTKQTDVLPYDIIVKAEFIEPRDNHGNEITGNDAWYKLWKTHLAGGWNS